jgi:hypothetical protein
MGVSPAEPAIERAIHFKAMRLVGHFGFRASDLEDIEQHLALQIIQNAEKLTARTASQMTVIDRALRNEIANLIEKRCAQKRDDRRDISVEEAPGSALVRNNEATDRLIDRLDVDQAITSLPAHLQRLARELRQSAPSEASRRLNLTRGQLRHQMAQIAKHFRNCGIGPAGQPDRSRSRSVTTESDHGAANQDLPIRFQRADAGGGNDTEAGTPGDRKPAWPRPRGAGCLMPVQC